MQMPAYASPAPVAPFLPPASRRSGPSQIDPLVAKIARLVPANSQDPEAVRTFLSRLHEAFQREDTEQSGELNYREYVGALRSFTPPNCLTDQEMHEAFEAYDPEGTGYVPLDLFWGDLQQGLLSPHEPAPAPVNLADVRARVRTQAASYDRLGNTSAGLARSMQKYDTNNDGRLTRYQLHRAFQELRVTGLTVPEFDVLFASFDHQGDGRISILEFAEAVYRDLHGPLPPPAAIQARVAGNLQRSKYPILSQRLKSADTDMDGMVSRNQFLRVLKSCDVRSNDHELNALFDIHDPNHTGKVSIREFLGSVYSGC
eukprot:TRINITY_DN4243_c0_g1_i1.p2 TRINITY_DN4243_c0_g1~~TRINITY_DN4243_c0_g1_i1.p2  ORF type:complete len:315 (-),score=94.55 TRINITY_DN4243_c0_g1_i1:319-1263(-)